MAVFFSNTQGATKISAPPRVTTVYDNVSGGPCWGSARSNPLISTSITVNGPTYFRITGTFIRYVSGRTDAYVYIVGPAGSVYASNTKLTNRLNHTGATYWDNVVFDVGAYGDIAGTYTISLTADSPSSWGCGRYHGRMSVLTLEV